MITAKTFIETETEIVFKPKKYDGKVKQDQIIKGSKMSLPRATILKLINGCTQPNQQRLRMILLLLSACGSRIGESLLLRLSDLHLDGLPHYGTEPPYYPYIIFRGEITKTSVERITLLTNEMAEQLTMWIKGKYATRNRTSFDNNYGKYRTVSFTPEKNPDDYVFLNIDNKYNAKDAALFVYNNLLQLFHQLLKDLGLTPRTTNGQRAITPHKIRMAVRSEMARFVTDAKFPDFYIGHGNPDTYYNLHPELYKEQFKLCQSALTYLDQTAIIKTQGDLQKQIHSIEEKQTEQITTTAKEVAELRSMVAYLIKSNASIKVDNQAEPYKLQEYNEILTPEVKLDGSLEKFLENTKLKLTAMEDKPKEGAIVGKVRRLELVSESGKTRRRARARSR